MGYYRAGFDVVGVDIKPQPRYPFEFHQADALTYPLEGFDAIHASPPCQAYSTLKHRASKQTHPKLIPDVLTRLESSGLPFVIENVIGSGLPRSSDLFGLNGVMLCGSMFGKRFRRHRLFRTSFVIFAPTDCDHRVPALNPYNAKSRLRDGLRVGAMKRYMEEMGVSEWMKDQKVEGSQAIPPCYTEYVGKQLFVALEPTSHH